MSSTAPPPRGPSASAQAFQQPTRPMPPPESLIHADTADHADGRDLDAFTGHASASAPHLNAPDLPSPLSPPAQPGLGSQPAAPSSPPPLVLPRSEAAFNGAQDLGALALLHNRGRVDPGTAPGHVPPVGHGSGLPQGSTGLRQRPNRRATLDGVVAPSAADLNAGATRSGPLQRASTRADADPTPAPSSPRAVLARAEGTTTPGPSSSGPSLPRAVAAGREVTAATEPARAELPTSGDPWRIKPTAPKRSFWASWPRWVESVALLVYVAVPMTCLIVIPIMWPIAGLMAMDFFILAGMLVAWGIAMGVVYLIDTVQKRRVERRHGDSGALTDAELMRVEALLWPEGTPGSPMSAGALTPTVHVQHHDQPQPAAHLQASGRMQPAGQGMGIDPPVGPPGGPPVGPN